MERGRHDIRVSSAILGADLTPTEKMVYIAVRSRQGEGEWCFASQETLATDIGSAKAVVNRAMKVLEGRGWIERDGRKCRCLDASSGDEKSPKVDEKSPIEDRSKVDEKSPKVDEKSPDGDEKSPRSESQPRKKNQKKEESASALRRTPGSPAPEKAKKGKGQNRDPDLLKPAVGMYRRILQVAPNREQAKRIGAEVEDLSAWEGELRRTLEHGWRKTNVPGLLERYHEATAKAVNGHERSNGRTQSGLQKRAEEYPEYRGLLER